MNRLLDLTLSLAALIVLSPVLLVIAVLIVAGDRGPVFYRGVRVGRHGVPFRIFKFRSMVVDAEKRGAASTALSDARLTRVGAVLRRYKLDELPQLLNVLVGDMSLVGPRPEVQKFVDLYTDAERRILDVRPGITDWSSIRFHDEGGIIERSGIKDADEAYATLIRPEKIRLQLAYVERRNLTTDIRIIFETVRTVVGSLLVTPRRVVL
jgi:lipopolysaccharide/colanic/teichoic acid biosynthesis glycosyltransferase